MVEEPLVASLRRDDAAWAREHLETDLVAWLTTVAPDGRPQSSVVSFVHESGTILIYSEPETPKMRNLAHTAQVSFNLQSDPYGDHYLVIEGTMAIDRSVPPADRHAAYAAKHREAYAHWKMDPGQAAADFSVPLRLTPSRVRVA